VSFRKSVLFLCLLAFSACGSKGDNLPEMPAVTAAPQNVSYLQMGTFADRHEAEQLLLRTSRIGVSAYIVHEKNYYHVKLGPYADVDQALRHKLDIDRMLNIEARVVFE
jgi:cell division protein FtsN